jgi:hypothetical protein
MTWWQWMTVAIWGPSLVAVVGMLFAAGVQKTQQRIEDRRPVTTDRRTPHRAALREAIDRRGVLRGSDPTVSARIDAGVQNSR